MSECWGAWEAKNAQYFQSHLEQLLLLWTVPDTGSGKLRSSTLNRNCEQLWEMAGQDLTVHARGNTTAVQLLTECVQRLDTIENIH